MKNPLEATSTDHVGTAAHSKRVASIGQENPIDTSRVLQNNLTSKVNNLDSDHRHSWIKFESPVDLMIGPMYSTQAPPSPVSVYSCEDSAEHHDITSAPMIREQAQSYIGWTSIGAPFRNQPRNLPTQLLSPTSEIGGTWSSPRTLDYNMTSPNLSPSPSHTQNCFINQENLSPRSPKSLSRKISKTFKGYFRKSTGRET